MKTQDNIYGSEDTRELLNPTFTEASSRANIDSGESHKTIFGKIKKFFTDLKTVAFTGAYSDLSGTPTLATVATSGKYSDLSGKPTLGDLAAKSTDSSTSHYLRGDGKWVTPPDTNTWRPLGTGASDACAGNDSRLSNSRPASDVYSWAKAASKPSYTASEVGAAASNHNHDDAYLKLSGGTVTGNVNIEGTGPSYGILSVGTCIRSTSGHTIRLVDKYCNLQSQYQAQVRNNVDTAWGPIYASAFTVQSSIRYKENISNITEEEARKLLDIRVVKYDYKDGVVDTDRDKYNRHGVIAEEVNEIIPEVVQWSVPYIPGDENEEEREEMPEAVDYARFVPYLIKMVQMQQAEIEELKKKVN